MEPNEKTVKKLKVFVELIKECLGLFRTENCKFIGTV